MKKVLLSGAIIALSTFGVFAQDTDTEIKPVAKSITVEVQALSPFSGGGASPFSLDNNSLRFRYFLSDKMAIRTNFAIWVGENGTGNQKQDFGGTSTSTSGSNSSASTNASVVVKSNSFLLQLAPGLEFHKDVSKRLNVYYGGYIDFALNSKSGSIDVTPGNSSFNGNNSPSGSGTYTYELSGANFGDISSATNPFNGGTNVTLPSTNSEKGYTKIGLMGVVGADYYFTKGLYLGLEVAWGFNTKSMHTEKSTQTSSLSNNPTPATTTTTVTERNGGSSFTIAPAVSASFRFGFKF